MKDGKREGQRAAGTGVDTDQPRAQSVGGRGAQCLAVDRGAEEPAQPDDQDGTAGQHADRLAGDIQLAEIETGVGQRWRAGFLGAEEHEAEADQHEMQRHGDDQQRQYRGIGDRAEREAPDQRPHRRDDRQCEQDRDAGCCHGASNLLASVNTNG